MIDWQFLGAGVVRWFVESTQGEWILCHVLEYPNTDTTPHIEFPHLQLKMYTVSSTSNISSSIHCSSAAAFIQGKKEILGTINSISNSKSTVTTEVNVLTIRNKSTYQSQDNANLIFPKFLSVANDGTKIVKYRLLLNDPLTSTSYTDISTNTSVVEYDTSGTLVSTGKVLAIFTCAKDDSKTIDLSELGIELNPGDSLTITAQSSASTDIECSITWKEDL